ncbi:MAG TPA: 2-oxoacid:acceptor oxidoreductase family protein, partial [bacterium]|nr:2-oxoacid:acceptor oxidoreductase family protein [bacterium]
MIHEEIIIAGFGGQGILYAGKVLATAAMREDRQVTYLPSYGAEVRGGTAFCHTVIAEEEIATPVVTDPTAAVILNTPSKEKFEGKVRKGGLIVLNTSLTGDIHKRADAAYVDVDATEIAERLGNVRATNMVMVGAFAGRARIVPLEALVSASAELL